MSKRKSDGHVDTSEPLAKRLRPTTLPTLPPIEPEFEKYVFTHPSVATRENGNPIHYDRLEFLGDAHLQLIATKMIYDNYPTAGAGRMAQIRQQLVQNETLCQYAQMYGFDKKLKINAANQRSKMPLTKVYGDVFEAYIGALFRSDPINGPAKAEAWLKELWAPVWEEMLRKFPPEVLGQKEALARKIMVSGVRLDYVDEKAPVVNKGKGTETYFVGVYLTGWGYKNQHLGSGRANSKSQAGQEAAMAALSNKSWMDELSAKKAIYVKEREEQSQSQAKEVGGSNVHVP